MIERCYNSTVRDAAAEKTRKRIVAAAVRLLATKGAAGFSLDAVGRKADVTRLTVYNQFGSRRALLDAVFDDRARRGGLTRLHEVMALPDARAALTQVIGIFCDFWSFDHDAVANLHAMGGTDAEFAETLAARNERRRATLGTLVARLAEQGALPQGAVRKVTDILFALTGFGFFTDLARPRGLTEAARLVQALAAQTLADAEKKRPG